MRIWLSSLAIATATTTLPPASLEEAARKGDMGTLKRFIEEGVDWSSDEYQMSAVSEALDQNQMIIYRYLRDVVGADVNRAEGHLGYTALHEAIRSGHLANVRAVLDDGGSIDTRRLFSVTPLFDAINLGNKDMFHDLIYRGADIHALNDRGFNPLAYAIILGEREMALELLALGCEVNIRVTSRTQETPLLMAVAKGWEDVATALVEAGADVDAGDYEETTPLILAVKRGYIGIVRMLIAHNADVNRISKCNGKYSAILAAHAYKTDEKSMELTRLLLEEGRADPNLTDSEGLSLLHRVADMELRGVASLLIEFGARVHARDKLGRTPKVFAKWLAGWRCYPDDEEWIAEFGP